MIKKTNVMSLKNEQMQRDNETVCNGGRRLKTVSRKTKPPLNALGKEKKKSGRPDLRRKKKLVSKLVHCIELGLTFEKSCLNAGIDKSTFYGWMREGKNAQGETLAKKFYNKIARAKIKAEKDLLEVVMGVANGSKKGDFKAATWLLERRCPRDYGKHRIDGGKDDVDELVTLKEESAEDIIFRGL